MLFLLSPSKTLDMEAQAPTLNFTHPALLDESKTLVQHARKLSKQELAELMSISEKLATLNYDRFKAFSAPFTTDNATPAIFAFRGDVYDGFDVESLDADTLRYAQEHLRILSGLYGVLRPLDLMQAYRLEMGIKLANPRGKNLYEFWGERITEQINQQLASTGDAYVANLASNEYFKAVKPKSLNAKLITPVFKEKRDDGYKVIALMAKKARGRMAAWALKHQIETPDALCNFAEDSYHYNDTLSDEYTLVFTRGD